MYIEIHNVQEMEQKNLYFKLQNCLNMDREDGLNTKIAGLYAIYKDEICLYVGQSKNIASRLATHIKGKYEDFSNIYIWDIKEIGFGNFDERPKEAQTNILLNSEKYLMTLIKPIENLLIDMDFKLEECKTPDISKDDFSTYTIQNNKYHTCIMSSEKECIEDLEIFVHGLEVNKEIKIPLRNKILTEIYNSTSRSFNMRYENV